MFIQCDISVEQNFRIIIIGFLYKHHPDYDHTCVKKRHKKVQIAVLFTIHPHNNNQKVIVNNVCVNTYLGLWRFWWLFHWECASVIIRLDLPHHMFTCYEIFAVFYQIRLRTCFIKDNHIPDLTFFLRKRGNVKSN